MDHIARALVEADSRTINLYQTNVFFNRAIDSLAALLPAWIEGLALQAQRNAREIEQMRARMENWPPDPDEVRRALGPDWPPQV